MCSVQQSALICTTSNRASRSQVSTIVALDHQTYSTLAQHTQITQTVVLNMMSLQGWESGGWVTTASYEVPPSGRLFHIRSGPPHLWTYSNCCQVCSQQVEHLIFIFSERSKQNGLHFIYIPMTHVIILIFISYFLHFELWLRASKFCCQMADT